MRWSTAPTMPTGSMPAGSRAASTSFRRNRVSPAQGAVHDDNLHQHYRDPVFELGGDVTRPFAEGALKFVALATRRKRHDSTKMSSAPACIADDAPVNGGFEQWSMLGATKRSGGSAGPARTSRLLFRSRRRSCLNTLDDHVSFSEIDEDGEVVPIPLLIADARVKEKRGEAYVNVGKTLSPDCASTAGSITNSRI